MKKKFISYSKYPTNIDELAFYGPKVQRFWKKKIFDEIIIIFKKYKNIRNVLEIGCGSGVYTKELVKHSNFVIASDISLKHLKYVRKKCNVSVINLNAESIPLKSNSIDIILLIDVIEHIPNFLSCLKECNRVLRKGGKLIIGTPNHYSIWPIVEYLWNRFGVGRKCTSHLWDFSAEQIKTVLRETGFSNFSFKSIFLFSPFLSVFSIKIADFIYRRERNSTYGMYVIFTAKK